MVGLVLDGGSAFAQRRDEQCAADLAALAAANDYLLNHDDSMARARARAVAASNGYTHGTNGVVVTMAAPTIPMAPRVQVDISAPHRNNFSSILGMTNWNVSTTAIGGDRLRRLGHRGRADHLQHQGVRHSRASRWPPTGTRTTRSVSATRTAISRAAPATSPGPTTGSATSTPTRFATSSGATCVIDRTIGARASTSVRKTAVSTTTSSTRSTTFTSGENIPVPIVDENGDFQGWATFHVTSADKASKTVAGYFVSPVVNSKLTIKACGFGSCPRYFGNSDPPPGELTAQPLQPVTLTGSAGRSSVSGSLCHSPGQASRRRLR